MDLLVPLSALVMENYARTIDELAGQLGDDVVHRAGVRWCTESTAQRLSDEREAEKAAQRKQQAELAARCAEIRRENPIGRGVPVSTYHAGLPEPAGPRYGLGRPAPTQSRLASPIEALRQQELRHQELSEK